MYFKCMQLTGSVVYDVFRLQWWIYTPQSISTLAVTDWLASGWHRNVSLVINWLSRLLTEGNVVVGIVKYLNFPRNNVILVQLTKQGSIPNSLYCCPIFPSTDPCWVNNYPPILPLLATSPLRADPCPMYNYRQLLFKTIIIHSPNSWKTPSSIRPISDGIHIGR